MIRFCNNCTWFPNSNWWKRLFSKKILAETGVIPFSFLAEKDHAYNYLYYDPIIMRSTVTFRDKVMYGVRISVQQNTEYIRYENSSIGKMPLPIVVNRERGSINLTT